MACGTVIAGSGQRRHTHENPTAGQKSSPALDAVAVRNSPIIGGVVVVVVVVVVVIRCARGHASPLLESRGEFEKKKETSKAAYRADLFPFALPAYTQLFVTFRMDGSFF